MMKSIHSLKYTLAMVMLGAFTVACQDDAVEPSANAKVNAWIYDVMDEVYYWSDEMPAEVNKEQEPEAFYESLHSAEDRFSYIVPEYQDLINSLNGISKEAGYEFDLFRVQDSDDVFAAIVYVKENSPASAAGLKRGDEIYKINGSQITVSNYKSLMGDISADHSIEYQRWNDESGAYEVQPQLDLQVVELAENPSFMDTVYAVGGKKIGYFVYNFFASGTDGAYDKEVDQIMANFKSEGVNEVILDLRYNSGGSVASATNLASLLGKNIDDTKIFFENRWNKLLQEYWENNENGEARLRQRFINKSEKVGESLSAGRLYILTGSNTASASELIINGLRPYMDVYLIGDQTVGKNVASIPFEDTDNPENSYGILPIVLMIFNSEGSSDYGDGFPPNFAVNEYQFPLKALGDLEEPLLAQAVAHITGSGARISTLESSHQAIPIMSSIDKKLRTNRMFLEAPEGLKRQPIL